MDAHAVRRSAGGQERLAAGEIPHGTSRRLRRESAGVVGHRAGACCERTAMPDDVLGVIGELPDASVMADRMQFVSAALERTRPNRRLGKTY